MHLYEWAASPFGKPPPIPFETPTIDSSAEYAPLAVAALPAEAFRDDVAALGLTYSQGRGNGYRCRGLPVDVYTATDPIIALIDEAGALLLDAVAHPPNGHEYEAHQLAALGRSLCLTARHIRVSESRRYSLLRLLRQVMKPATKTDVAAALARAYLDDLPESEISRPALRAAVSDALARDGFTIGPKQLFALIDEHPRLIGPYKRQGTYYYRVRPRPS